MAIELMVTTLLSSLALLPLSVGSMQLHALWERSELVVLARVEKVEKIRHELPEWESTEPPGPEAEVPLTSIAQLRVLRTFRGPKDARSILVPTDRSFICDITEAMPGETAIFFLEGSRVLAAEGSPFRAELDQVFGEHDFMRISFFGRGRMPVFGTGDSKCVESWTDVLFPEGVRMLPLEPGIPHDAVRSTPYAEFCRVLETYRQLEEDFFLSASSTPGASGGLGWSLAVAREGPCRLSVFHPDSTVDGVLHRGAELEYVFDLDPGRLGELRESMDVERPWNLPSTLGTLRPGPNQREMHFVRRGSDPDSVSEAGVHLFAIDAGWMADSSQKESTHAALRLWSKIRGLFPDGTCADSRWEDQAWLAAGR